MNFHIAFITAFKIQGIHILLIQCSVHQSKVIEDVCLEKKYSTTIFLRIYHTEEKKNFEITEDCVPTILFLLDAYPEYKAVRSIPLKSDVDKVRHPRYIQFIRQKIRDILDAVYYDHG